MMKNVRMVLVGLAVLALVATACDDNGEDSGDEAEEAPSAAGGDEGDETDEMDELDELDEGDEAAGNGHEVEEEGMEFMQKVAEVGVENVDDCDAIATAWAELIEENEDLLERINERAEESTPEEQADFEERYAEELEGVMGDMTEIMGACQEHEDVLGLMEEMSTQ